MIKYDEKLLEQRLLEVVRDYFHYESPYLIIEELGFLMNLSEENRNSDYQSYKLKLAGIFGNKLSPEPEKHFEFIIDSRWSYDFIKGYFCRYIEE